MVELLLGIVAVDIEEDIELLILKEISLIYQLKSHRLNMIQTGLQILLYLFYADGEKRYILSPFGIKVGDEIISGENAPLRVGNSLPIKKVATGMFVHNIELVPGRGGQLVRSAGAACTNNGS